MYKYFRDIFKDLGIVLASYFQYFLNSSFCYIFFKLLLKLYLRGIFKDMEIVLGELFSIFFEF